MWKILIVFVILVKQGISDIYFGRSFQCANITQHACLSWEDHISLRLYSYYYGYMCFPGEVEVITEQGPKSLADLMVGDRILCFNDQTNSNQFSEVLTWMDRDINGIYEFNQIQTKDQTKYLASSGHNVAYVQDDGSIGYKYAANLKQGDQLISLGRQQIVQSSSQILTSVGKYAPFTEMGNFYVLPVQSEWNRDTAILVHCLSSTKYPQILQKLVYSLVIVQNQLGMNQIDFSNKQKYVNPINYILKILPLQKLTHVEIHQVQMHEKGRSRSSSISRSAFYGGVGGAALGTTYSNQHDRKKQKQRNQLMALIGLTKMSESIYFN